MNFISLMKKIKGRLFSLIHTPYMHYGHMGKNVKIDKRYIDIFHPECIFVGDGVKIHANLRMIALKKYGNEAFSPQIKIGNNVHIGQNFHCACAQSILIGDGTTITPNCGICDIVHPYEDVSINPRWQNIEVSPVVIGENCMIGMNSVILAGVVLGNHVVVGANSVVTHDVPDFCVVVGAPARIIKRYNVTSQTWEKTDPQGNFIRS
ncbi:DapH/DapD/GlmU-related protein [Fibrobacter sp. UWB12]|uniref:acyltransferase n=1 Tax=Fibrobacter sp. UWB12 TaxID=1896203 RepID=UPI00091A7ED0|nr:acyltransferase [Fibrobacter sp. UWB12]SHK26526.1 Acetyltransferase (isoleucine patch superfamily) [Fibrobacter sp. UWB12]